MTTVYDNFDPVITGTFNGDSNQDAIWASQGMPPGYLEDFDFSQAIFNSFEQINYNWMAMDMPGKAIFSSSQFGPGSISNSVEIYGAWGRTDLIINVAQNGSLDASGWVFKQGNYYNWLTGEDYVFINGTIGNEQITGTSVDDTFTGGLGNDQINGGAGTDTAVYSQSRSAYSVSESNGVVTISGPDGSDSLTNIEFIKFSDQTIGTTGLPTSSNPPSNSPPLYASPTSNTGYVQAETYTGPVAFLNYQYLGSLAGDVVTGSSYNDFINLLAGDDAANGAAGRDVLDGGLGSSFLTGGSDADVFFVDGREAVATWSTITDFSHSEGDTVNLWGWREGTSRLVTSTDDGGAAGYTGATFHYDLDNNGAIDTSITFAGLTTSQVGNPSANSVAGNGYLLWS